MRRSKAGEFLKLMEKNKGNQGNGRPLGGRTQRPPKSEAPTLADIGITKDESSLWQKVADIPGRTMRALQA